MTTEILVFIVTVPSGEVDVASDILWQLGVRAIEERELDAGAVELRTSVGQESAAIARAAATLDPKWSWRTESVSTIAAETWREHAQANWITRDLVIVPEWLEFDTAPDVTRVVIEPAGAFGLGDHPTSQLSARVLRDELARRAGTVLDVGCGTGVLSIVAAVSGATSVRAIDISADAVGATVANAELNGVADTIDVDDSPLHDVDGTFDVVVANILAPVLIASSVDLRRVTSANGRLVISGILASAHEHVIAALRPMVVVDTATQAGWAAITLRH